jgi:tetratricopeptide (TPR) repeat protein
LSNARSQMRPTTRRGLMAITYKGLTAGTLFLATAVATGCSTDRPTSPQKEAQASTQPATTKPVEDVGFTPAPAPVVTGPATFADGEAAFTARKYTEASNIFGRYVQQHPDNPWGHFMLGLSWSKSGDAAAAEKAFDEALRLDPNHVKSLTNLGRVLIDLKRSDEAIEKLTKAGEIDPTSGSVQRLLARAYDAQGKSEDAVKAYQRAIEIDAKDSWAMNNLGLVFIKQGRAADAVTLLTKAIEIDKNVAAFHNNLGMALEHTGRFADAAAAYKGALTADPGYEKAQRNLARVEKVKEAPRASTDEKTEPPVVGKTDAAKTTPVADVEDR